MEDRRLTLISAATATHSPRITKVRNLINVGFSPFNFGGILIDTNRLGVKSQCCELQYQEDHQYTDRCNEERCRNGNSRNKSTEIAEGRITYNRKLVVVDPCCNGTSCRIEDQGRYHGLDLEICYQAPLKAPKSMATHRLPEMLR